MAGNRVLLRVSIRPAMSWVPWSGLRVSFRWEVRAGVLMCSIKIVTHLFARQATTMAYPDAMPVFEGLYAFRSVFQERKGLRVFRLSICNIPVQCSSQSVDPVNVLKTNFVPVISNSLLLEKVRVVVYWKLLTFPTTLCTIEKLSLAVLSPVLV